eukprot:9471746-Pyramimonas_sp.AAC.1
MEGRGKGEGRGWNRRGSSRRRARSRNHVAEPDGHTLMGGSGRRAQAARSSRQVAEVCVLHKTRGTL